MDQVDICKVGSWSTTVSQLTEISEPKDCVTPPGCLGCIGIELPRPPWEELLHHHMSQNDVGFWMLWFDSLSGWCYMMPSTSCSFPHIRSWRRPRAKSNMITSPRFQASRSRNWLEQIVHAAALKTPESQIGTYSYIVLKNKAYNLTEFPWKDSNLFP